MVTDYISRDAAQNITAAWLSSYITDEQRETIENIDALLGEIPAADVVEVVRCKDCKSLYRGEFGDLCCSNHSGLARCTEDSFCCYWEGKNDN